MTLVFTLGDALYMLGNSADGVAVGFGKHLVARIGFTTPTCRRKLMSRNGNWPAHRHCIYCHKCHVST